MTKIESLRIIEPERPGSLMTFYHSDQTHHMTFETDHVNVNVRPYPFYGHSIFGSEFQYVESQERSCTSNTRWKTKIDWTTDIKPAGIYRIQVSFKYLRGIEVHVLVDSVQEYRMQEDEGSCDTIPIYTIWENESSHNIMLQFKSTSPFNNVEIWHARIEIMRCK